MMFCKKKSGISIWSVIGFMTAALGIAIGTFALFKCLKKHFGCFCGKDCSCHGMNTSDLLSGLDLDPDDGDDLGCACPVRETNDVASNHNAVVNSENRMVNIEN